MNSTTLPISVIILTCNEEKQIERCINSAKNIVSNTFIIDSDSNDNTINIAENFGATCIKHSWKEIMRCNSIGV